MYAKAIKKGILSDAFLCSYPKLHAPKNIASTESVLTDGCIFVIMELQRSLKETKDKAEKYITIFLSWRRTKKVRPLLSPFVLC